MILDILIGENQDLSSNLLFFLGSSMIIFTIVKFVSNISLTSKALGQGLIPNLFDINSIKNNFGIFSRLYPRRNEPTRRFAARDRKPSQAQSAIAIALATVNNIIINTILDSLIITGFKMKVL